MTRAQFMALLLLLAGLGLGFFVYSSQRGGWGAQFPFSFGLDLTGGTHLVYKADTSELLPDEVHESMTALRDVIERRVNFLGVSEPLVQVEQSSIVSGTQEQRLIVELPGVTDVNEAIRIIGETPELEFQLVKDPTATSTEARYEQTGLTGRYLTRASLQFISTTGSGVATEPVVQVQFNEEGKRLFSEITTNHVGEQLAIFLDGALLSEPTINEAITEGTAIISGGFEAEEARELARNLNIGALPVPVELVSTQTIGASLGNETLYKGVIAGLLGLGAVALFLMVWYRLPGCMAVLSLTLYVLINLSIFKLIPVALTAAGIAGFILSIGMAVDANILIFERIKEELRRGKELEAAMKEGFARAWLPIRDGNLTGILSAVVLYWFGTSIVQGFALTLIIGVLVSMFTALTATRMLLFSLVPLFKKRETVMKLFGSGFTFK